MKVKMKQYEKDATDYAKRFTKAWDYFAVASDAFLAGYKKAKEDAVKVFEVEDVWFGKIVPPEAYGLGENTVEVKIPAGEQQLSPSSFEKWHSRNSLDGYSFTTVQERHGDDFIFFDIEVEKK